MMTRRKLLGASLAPLAAPLAALLPVQEPKSLEQMMRVVYSEPAPYYEWALDSLSAQWPRSDPEQIAIRVVVNGVDFMAPREALLSVPGEFPIEVDEDLLIDQARKLGATPRKRVPSPWPPKSEDWNSMPMTPFEREFCAPYGTGVGWKDDAISS